jgi:nitrous oxidase accessory protein NosD
MRTRRVLEGMSGTLTEISETLRGMNVTLNGMNATLNGMNATLHGMNATLHGMNATMNREFKITRAAVENNTRVTREIVLELREQRPILEHIDDGVAANNKGLMHVLDELRNGRGGPGTAPAT